MMRTTSFRGEAGFTAAMQKCYRAVFCRRFKADRDTALFLLRQAVIACGSALLSGDVLPFGARPFDIALIASGGLRLPVIAAGCILGAALRKDYLRALLLLAESGLLFAIGWTERSRQSSSSPGSATPPLPLLQSRTVVGLAAAVSVLPAAAPRFLTEGFRFHALFAGLLELSIAVSFALLLRPLQRPAPAEDPSAFSRLPGRTALFAALCHAAAAPQITLFGLQPAAGLALLLILYSCRHFDPLTTVAIGLGCGIGCGTETVPVTVACAATAILVQHFSKRLYVAAAMLSAMLVALKLGGFSALTGTLPSLVAGGCCYAMLFRLDDHIREEISAPPPYTDPGQGLLLEALVKERETASTLLELASELAELSEKTRTPARERLLVLCDEVFGELLKGNDPFLPAVDRMALVEGSAGMLQKRGNLEWEDLPVWFREHCPKSARKYLESCNRRSAALRKLLREDDRAGDFAACYRTTAKLLQDGAKHRKEELLPDPTLSLKATEAAKALGLHFESATVRGKGKLHLTLYGLDLARLGVSATRLQTVLGKACEVPFGPPKISMENGGRLEMESLPILRFESYAAKRKKEGEVVCGDELSDLAEEESFCALLSDGMGSGAEASAAARFCCCIAKHLIACGGSPTVVARSIGEFLLHQTGECSATLDLMRVDACTGKAIFLKCGAVPTFILRDGGIFKISAATMPLGITRELNAECVTAKLLPGDIVVLCSDGVVPDLDAEVKLCKLLTGSGGASLAVLTELIVERADRKDDASVMMVRISDAMAS